MRSRFESAPWLTAVAHVVESSDAASTANALIEAIGIAVDHEGTCLLEFRADAAPTVLHHTLEPAGRRHYVDRYVAGPYLLDPLYQLATSAGKPGLCRYRDASPDRFRASAYYQEYCKRTHLRDEIDYLVDVGDGATLALVVGRRTRRFSRTDVGRLRLIEPFVHAAMRSTWRQWADTPVEPGAGAAMHRRLTRAFDRFGEGSLTDREREITQLLLRGHSTKSVARELDIAPGTVMVHKRNLFAKLGITSQYELFSRFIDSL